MEVRGGQSDPDNPVSVRFNIQGRTYTVSNVYYEQETIINFNEEEKTAGIYTHNKALRQKLAALARDRPEDCRLVKASRSGRAVDYTIPKSWIKIVPPRIASEAQKAALARARKAASKPL